MKNLRLTILFLIATLLFASLVRAADDSAGPALVPADNAAQKTTELEEMVVTTSIATRTEKNLKNVPAVVTIIDQEQIKQMPARTVGDLLRDLGGIDPSEPQGVGLVTPQIVTMRGNGFTGHTLVMLDGQPFNSPHTSYSYLTLIPVKAVDRIEVVRGSFSALYGSSAGAGIINIITKDGGDKSSLGVWGKSGDFGRHDHGVDAGIVFGRFSLGLFYDNKYTDNYYLYDDNNLNTDERSYRHDRIHGKLTGSLGDRTDISLSGGSMEGYTGYGVGDNLGFDLCQNVEQSYLNFNLKNRTTDKLELIAQVDWQQFWAKFHGETMENVTYRTFTPYPGGPIIQIPSFNYVDSMNRTMSERYRGDFHANYSFNPNQVMTLGGEASKSKMTKKILNRATGDLLEVQGRKGEGTDETSDSYSFYAQYDATFRKFEFVLGGRYDHYKDFGGEFSPKATVKWQYHPNGNLKFSVAKGFRAPTLNELYSTPWSISPFIVYMGNSDLEPEILWSYEFSWEHRFWRDKVFARLTPYYTYGKDFINSVRYADPYNAGGQIMQPQNLDEVEIKGLEAEFSVSPWRFLTLFANWNFSETKDKKTGERLDGYPLQQGALGLRSTYDINDDWTVRGYYSMRYKGSYDETTWGVTAVTDTYGDYWFHTASAGIGFKDMVNLKVEVFNLFNDRTEVAADDYFGERNYMVELSFKYTF